MTIQTQSIDLGHRILGVDEPIPLLDGTRAPYVNLDKAASTPPFKGVMDEIARFMPYYSSVHEELDSSLA